jgi:hypothetical protein
MIHKYSFSKIALNLLWFALAIAALMSPALINGFPLVYSDTGTYIAAAKTSSIPVDRPISYSLFLNITSLNLSLWFTILAQCAILVYLLFLLLKNVFGVQHSQVWTCGLTILLSFTTSISNYSSQLMPDIFAGWMLLIVFILLFGQNNQLVKITLWLLFIISVTSHFSILVAATIMLFLLLTINLIWKWLPAKTNLIVLMLIITGWLTTPVINSLYGEKFSVSRCKNISLMARLVETGIVKEYLEEHCPDKNYPLCQYKDSLPAYGYLFAWEPTSPLYKGPCWGTGWGNCWIEKDQEYGILIRDIISSPKYLKKLFVISMKDTYRQLLDFKIGVLVPMKEQSAPFETIQTFYPQHLQAYKSANQYNRILYFHLISKIQTVFVITGIAIISILLIWNFVRRNKHRLLNYLTSFLLFGIVLNAAVCSSLSTVVDRYQSRVIWLIPFLLAVYLIVIISDKKQKL